MSHPSDEYWAWLLDSMRCGVVAVDDTGCIVSCNDDARRLLGLEGEPRGTPCETVFADQPALCRLLREGLAGRVHPVRTELVLEPIGDAPRRAIGYTLCPVRDEAGRVRGAAVLFRDLTPIERLDERERLQGRLAALGEMAAGLAHEIRNPLAGMAVNAGLLRRRVADRPQELPLVEAIVREIHRIEQVVGQTLAFVRSDRPEAAPVDVVEVVEAGLARALARVGYAGRIERRFQDSLPSVSGDAAQLEALIAGLVENALEALASARPEQPVLEVRTALHKTEALEEIWISVGDNAGGVPEALRERVFYPFFTTKDTGLGIGLANAQKIAAAHGGSLTLDSNPGGGALFHLHLPLARVGS